jgi:protein-tyrosine phosphatase
VAHKNKIFIEMKILMVCLGNICRSPVAEGVLKHLASQKNIQLELDSAGTAGYHINEHPDHRSVKNAKKNGVDISKLKARKFTKSDFDAFDKIFVMDDSNYKNVISITDNALHHKKVDFLLNQLFPDKNLPVPDPYYGNEKDFEEVFQLIYKACDRFTDNLKSK